MSRTGGFVSAAAEVCTSFATPKHSPQMRGPRTPLTPFASFATANPCSHPFSLVFSRFITHPFHLILHADHHRPLPKSSGPETIRLSDMPVKARAETRFRPSVFLRRNAIVPRTSPATHINQQTAMTLDAITGCGPPFLSPMAAIGTIRTSSPANGDHKASLAARWANDFRCGTGDEAAGAPEELESIGGVSSTDNI